MALRTFMLVVAVLPLLAASAAAMDTPPPCGDQQSEGCMPPCPTGLTGYATEGGGVFLNWQLNSWTDVNVYRATGDGEFVLVERLEFPSTRYVDSGVATDTTYRYQVTAIGDHESESCGTFEITTVPELGTMLAITAAAGLGVLGYALARRKK